jgi:hypothetical protein
MDLRCGCVTQFVAQAGRESKRGKSEIRPSQAVGACSDSKISAFDPVPPESSGLIRKPGPSHPPIYLSQGVNRCTAFQRVHKSITNQRLNVQRWQDLRIDHGGLRQSGKYRY